MKQQTTIKHVKNYFGKVFQTGYCDLQYIFHHEQPQYYNAGVYGWNCDIYTDYARDIAITTGYRNMTGKRIPTKIIEKYSNIAKKIIEKPFTVGWEEKQKELAENRENFLDELNKL